MFVQRLFKNMRTARRYFVARVSEYAQTGHDKLFDYCRCLWPRIGSSGAEFLVLQAH